MKKLLFFCLLSFLTLPLTQAQVIEITSDTTKLATQTGRFREAYRQGVRYAKGASGNAEITGTRVFRSIAELRRFTTPVEGVQYYLSEKGKEGYWYYDAADQSSVDNTGIVVVTENKKRMKRANVNQIDCRWFLSNQQVDASDAIQAAINAGTELNQGVLIPAGRWLINKPLLLAVSLTKTLKITGQPGTILDFRVAHTKAAMATNAVDNSKITYGKIYVSGITWDGHRIPVHPGSQSAVKALYFTNCTWVELSNNTFQNIYGNGPVFRKCAGGMIDSNTFVGVYGRDSVYDAYGDALTLFDHAENFTIRNNTLRLESGQVGRCGIAVDVSSNHTTVVSNHITGYERGIHIEACANVLVTKNKVFKSPIGGYSAFNENVTWEDNYFSSGAILQAPMLSSSAVFFAYDDKKCVYRGNTVTNWHGQKDVRGDDTYLAKFIGNQLLIENNIFSKGNQVWAYGGYKNQRYLRNQFLDNVSLRIDVQKDATVESNFFYGGTLNLQSTTNASIIKNQFYPDVDQAQSGNINAYGAKSPYVADNVLRDCKNGFVIENQQTEKAVFEGNILLRTTTQAPGNRYFYTDINRPVKGVSKNYRPNQIKDYLINGSFLIGNSGVAQ